MRAIYRMGIDTIGRAVQLKADEPRRNRGGVRTWAAADQRFTVGIDEVGRGSLAGPVTVAAACIPAGLRTEGATLGALRDSKRLTPRARERWAAYFKGHPRIRYAISSVTPKVIDRINISRAANLAALRAFRKLVTICDLQPSAYEIILDGGLFLGNGAGRLQGRTDIRADKRFTAVKIASIIAKVRRDRLMIRRARRYPSYGFEMHKGYGTVAHRKALRRHGPCKVHRLTFIGFLKNSNRSAWNFSRKP